jgi:hypothetical protein
MNPSNKNLLLIIPIALVFFASRGIDGDNTQSDPTDRLSDAFASALTTAKEAMGGKEQETQKTPLFVPFEIDIDPPLPPNLIPEEPEVITNSDRSEYYWGILQEYRRTGGVSWVQHYSSGGRSYQSTGSRLQQHVAEHFGVSQAVFGNWTDADLNMIHGWAHEKERGVANELGEYQVRRIIQKGNVMTYPSTNCPTGNCPNTTRWFRR